MTSTKLKLIKILSITLAVTLIVFSVALAAVSDGVDVKVTNDNNNVDGGVPNPSSDAQNRQQNETTIAISPANTNIVATGANDYRMVTVTGDVWFGFSVSADGGLTWFDTFVPGFPTDTSAAGLASPLLGLDASGDPVVRFDAQGNLYAAGIAFNRNFDQGERPLDTAVYVAKYNYTPGTTGGTSSPSSAANPPNFTYAGTTVVDRGAVGFAVPGVVGFAGNFTDKEWMEIDLNPRSLANPCGGNVYVAYTSFHGASGNSPIKFNASMDGGATFSQSTTVSTGGAAGTPMNQGADIAVAPNGTIYVAYAAFQRGAQGGSSLGVVKSTDCGKHWSKPVLIGSISDPQAPGIAFRTPTFAFISVDNTNPEMVYVAYQNFTGGDYDIYVQRSTDGGATWGAPVQVNEDPGARHQLFPTIDVSGGMLHVAWYDTRNSAPGVYDALDVYYANTTAATYPVFSANERVTDVSHNPNCLLFGGGTAAFHGDYIELDAVTTGANQTVHVAWADNRDVSPCDLDPAPGPATNNTGNRNANIYADTLIVTP
jgi:hypothetical protein